MRNADGSNGHWARNTPFSYDLLDPSSSPDGSRLVLTVMVQGAPHIGWMVLGTGQIGIFNQSGAYFEGSDPSYDPTGKQIVYVASGGSGVDNITADASIHLEYVSCPAKCGHPTYSPDGKKIAFDQVVGAGNRDIFVKKIGGVTTRLTRSAGTDMQPT